MDKKRKKELKKAFKGRESAEARKKMCLFPDQLRELRACLSQSLSGLGVPCDHTLGRTTRWAAQEKLDGPCTAGNDSFSPPTSFPFGTSSHRLECHA